MARSAADLMLELAVLAGPDELAEGVGYQLALPPPRHDRLAGFRALVMDAHPLCPTAASVAGALDELTERLAKLGVHIVRHSAKLPDLALTTQTYVELLAAFFAADLTTDGREAVMAGARSFVGRRQEHRSLPYARLHDQPWRLDLGEPAAGRITRPLVGVVR